MPSIKCKDIGMKCGFEVKDESEDELMQILALHAEKTHNLKPNPPEVTGKVKKAIKKIKNPLFLDIFISNTER